MSAGSISGEDAQTGSNLRAVVNLIFDDAVQQNADGVVCLEPEEEFSYVRDATNRWYA